jgi:hypothetical protein
MGYSLTTLISLAGLHRKRSMTSHNDPHFSASPPPYGGPTPGVPASPNPLMGGDSPPTSPSGGSNKTVVLIAVGVGALLAMMTVGAGAFLLLSNRPEELSESRYAKKMCEDVVEPHAADGEDLMDKFEERVDEMDNDWKSANREFRRFMIDITDWADSYSDDIESFNDGHRLRGSSGDELHEQVADLVDDSRAFAESVREVVSDTDLVDLDLEADLFSLDSIPFGEWSDTLIGAKMRCVT